MEESRKIEWSEERRKLLQLLRQISLRYLRIGTSYLHPRRKSWSHSTVSTMRFINPFGGSSQDADRFALLAEGGGATPDSRRSIDDTDSYHDVEKYEYPILASFRSARNSVSYFLNEHLHLGGGRSWTDRFSWIVTYLQAIVFALLPDFLLSPIKHFFVKSTKNSTPKRLGATAYLDGLRGVAAFTVYIFHYTYLWFPKLRQGYASAGDNNLFWQMTIVRILHSGRSSVTIFFVISGYVLTIKTLKMIYNRQNEQVLLALAGSAFRRPLRLYLPIAFATFMIATICYNGYYIADPSGAPVPPIAVNFHDQVYTWFWDLVGLMNPFKNIVNRENIGGMAFDGHLWTIPIEFKGSMLVFLLLLIFARAMRWIHISATLAVTLWLVHVGDWDKALFPTGLLLAELSIILPATAASKDVLPRCNTPAVQKALWRYFTYFRHIVTIGLFFLGIHLMCFPEQRGSATPGFRWMAAHVPSYYQATEDRTQLHWNAVGSILLVIALMYSPPPTFSLTGCFRSLLSKGASDRPWYQTSPALDENEKEEMEAISSAATAPRDVSQGLKEAEKVELVPMSPRTVAPPVTTQPRAPPTSQSPVLVMTEPQEPLLQRIFTNRFAQYLGHISYSLYLWHGTVNHAVGMRWLVPAWTEFGLAQGSATTLPPGTSPEVANGMIVKALQSYNVSFFWGMLVNTLALLWVSDVFNRLFDVPCIKVTRWIGERSFRKD